METILFIILAILYYIGGYFLTKFIRFILTPFNKYFKVLILSFAYALLFGIGILGSGGDPGFAFPFPIIWTGLIYVWQWSEWTLFINGVMIPLLFWWLLIFIIMTIKLFIDLRHENDSMKIKEYKL